MKTNDTIDALIRLPRKFNSAANMSIYDLLKETGYFEVHDQIFVESIRHGIARCPNCVEDWITYSADKRSSFGWYLKQQDNQKYVVGYLNGKGNDACNEYSSRVDAFAIFIKHEIESIRTSPLSS